MKSPGVLLNVPSFGWYCPSCKMTDYSEKAKQRYHNCPKLRGLTAPMVRAGVKAKHVVLEREDYEGSDQLAQRDEDGRAIMSILTIRDDGYDCNVLAPTAIIKG